MPYVKEHEINYKIFSRFIEQCIIADRSLLWPEKQLWTLENLKKLQSMYGDETIEDGDKSFGSKLELQLKNASPEVWGIMADLFYIFTLPSATLIFDTKLSYIKWTADFAGYQLPDKRDDIWEPLHHGLIHTGIQYHMKFGQILLILLLSIYVKESENRSKLLNTPTQVEEILDQLAKQVGEVHSWVPRDMRQIILYLMFPEKYEAIISTLAKENIVDYYAEKLNLKVSEDIDSALYQVREGLENNLDEGETPLNFYDEKYKVEWDPTSRIVKDTTTEGPEGKDNRDVDPQLNSILHALKYSKNLILSGPPGTGKTYLANKAAEHLIQSQIDQKISEDAKNFRIVEGLTFYDLLALDLYLNDKEAYSVPDIETHDLVNARYTLRPVENPRQSIWNNLQTHTAPDSETVKVARRGEPYLFDKDGNSKWTLTAEGRKYVEQNLSDKLNEKRRRDVPEHKADDFIKRVTFHQSFAYEDFIEGIRPRIGEEESGEITYDIFPGVFSEISRIALKDRNNSYVLIIDEINRGNISKIFGELITLIEDDKREEMSVRLPYSKRDFVVPKNLYLIGTMNTADRSIALMDLALRRRFTFIEMMPRVDLLQDEYVLTTDVNLNLGKLLEKINYFIEAEIDRNHKIGHSYFLKVAREKQEDKLAVLNFVWNHQIFPLLKEYFYSQHEKLIDFLSPFTEDGQEGNFEEMLKEGDDLLFALNSIVDDNRDQ